MDEHESLCADIQYIVYVLKKADDLILALFFPQLLRNDVEYYGRSSRSPVMLFDIQDNNMNANSFTVN